MFASGTEEVLTDSIGDLKISTIKITCKYTAPWPFETMVFKRNNDNKSVYHRAHKTLETAKRWHQKIVAMCKTDKLPIGQGIRKGIGLDAAVGNPSLTKQQWKDGLTQGEPYSCRDHRVVITQRELERAMRACKISPNRMHALFDALREEGDVITPTWDEIRKEERENQK